MTKRSVLKTLFGVVFLIPCFAVHAQYKVKQVLIANGGSYGNPGNMVSIGSYNPTAKTYTLFDSVPGNSVTQILIDSGFAYMATDSYLVKYNLANLTRTNIAKCSQLRYIAAYKNEIVATLGDTAVHLKIFKKSDLSLVYSETKLPAFCNGITVEGDSAYIAVQGDWPDYNDTGKIAVEDLANQKLKHIISLDTTTKGIGDMYSNSDYVYGITENYPPVASEISRIDLKTGDIKITPVNNLNSPFALYDDTLYTTLTYGIEAFSMNSYFSVIRVMSAPAYAAAAYDTVNNLFYLTGANYYSPAMAYIYQYNGHGNSTKLDSFDIGVSPEGIAIDYERDTASGIHVPVFASDALGIYPNPANDHISISGVVAKNAEIKITDLTGRTVFCQNANLKTSGTMVISVSNLASGIYFVTLQSNEGMISKKFIKN